MIDSIRLTNTEKDLLVRIKRKTGIDSWNILCRWALVIGLTAKDARNRINPEKRDAIEIRWDTFVGKNKHIYNALTLLAYENNGDKGIDFSDFIHNRIEYGIRSIQKQINDKSILVFSDFSES
jgi:DNA sulfur modification protein DndE